MYRVHDAALGRWWQVDPAVERYYGLTPYNSMFNNPMIFDDPDGDDPISAAIWALKLSKALIAQYGVIGPVSTISVFVIPKVIVSAASTLSLQVPLAARVAYGLIDQSFVGQFRRTDVNSDYNFATLRDQYFVDQYIGNGEWQRISNPTYMQAQMVAKDFLPIANLGRLTQIRHVLTAGKTAKVVSRIQAGSLKEFKSLVQQLSKPGSQLTKTELQQFEKLTEQFGGKLRYDLNPVKGKILQPHVQVEGLGTSVARRHIWLGQ